MKKIYVFALASIAAVCSVVSCAKLEDNHTLEVPGEGELVTITASIPDDGITKVSFDQQANAGAIKLYWEAGDQITVTDASKSTNTQTFTLTSAPGSKTGTFSGTALTGSPSSYNITYDATSGFDYADQTQAADESTAHLRYVASLNGVNKYNDFTFSQSWATANGGGTFAPSSVLRLRTKLPAALVGNVQAVIFKADAAIFNGAGEIKVNLTNKADAGESGILTVYASFPAGDVAIPAGTKLCVQYQVSSTSAYTAFRIFTAAKTLQGGKVNALNFDCSDISQLISGVGTSASPYLIGNANQMDAMHCLTEAGKIIYFKQTANVNLTGVNWTPLNPTSPYDKGINYDGQNYTISNLHCESSTYPSFFGVLYGLAKNVTFEAPVITGTNTNVGVIGGYVGTGSYDGVASGITVNNAIVSLTVSSGKGRHAGGFAGYVGTADSSMSDCHVTGTTTITNNVAAGVTSACTSAGFLGYTDKAISITNCIVSGTVDVTMNTTKTGCSVGGFIGALGAAATINGCTAEANVNNPSSYYTGGFIGQASTAGTSFTDCAYLGGTVSVERDNTNSPAAGFIGRTTNDVVINFTRCYVDGATINASKSGRIGGFVGDAGNSVVFTKCYVQNSTISVTGSNGQRVGGFVGNTNGDTSTGSFTECYTKSVNVSGGLNTGGFGGVFYKAASKCHVDGGTITAGANQVGGFAAYPEKAMITNCYVTSDATINGGTYDNVGGFIGICKANTTVSSCYEAATVNGTGTGVGAFIGYVDAAPTSYTKNIAWNGTRAFYGGIKDGVDDTTITGNYTGTSGTISSQATTLSWDPTVWDLSGSTPTLK